MTPVVHLRRGCPRSATTWSLAGALFFAAGCARDVVQWEGDARASDAGAPVAWVAPVPPPDSAACDGSLVTAHARGDTAIGAWWSLRRDGSTKLMAARSDDGGSTWHEAVVADSSDRSRSGCSRPAPGLAVDPVTGYVHVVYFLVGREGPGVFFTHSMEGGEMFHEPVPIVYGERPSAAAVAAHADTVLVAYLDPNASAPQVWLALSRSTGHIFEQRAGVSSANTAASSPGVALIGREVTVSWDETARGGGNATRVQRRGIMPWQAP